MLVNTWSFTWTFLWVSSWEIFNVPSVFWMNDSVVSGNCSQVVWYGFPLTQFPHKSSCLPFSSFLYVIQESMKNIIQLASAMFTWIGTRIPYKFCLYELEGKEAREVKRFIYALSLWQMPPGFFSLSLSGSRRVGRGRSFQMSKAPLEEENNEHTHTLENGSLLFLAKFSRDRLQLAPGRFGQISCSFVLFKWNWFPVFLNVNAYLFLCFYRYIPGPDPISGCCHCPGGQIGNDVVKNVFKNLRLF